MANPSQLNPISDPFSLAKLQILLIPIHTSPRSNESSPTLSEGVYDHWTSLIKRHTVLRGDELRNPSLSSGSSAGHIRGGPSDARSRFFPTSTGSSISRGTSTHHVHLAFPSHPPARHLYPLSLLRMGTFPLVVIGIAVDSSSEEEVNGYSLEDEGDIGQVASTSRPNIVTSEITPMEAFEETVGNLMPPTSPYPLVRRLVVVPPHIPRSPTPNPTPTKAGNAHASTPRMGKDGDRRKKGLEDPSIRIAPSHGAEAWLNKVLADVVSEALGELGELASSLETPDGLQTLSATLLPSLTANQLHQTQSYSASPSTTPTPFRTDSTGPPVLSHSNSVPAIGVSIKRSLTPGGRPTSVQPASLPPIQTAAISSPGVSSSQSSNPFRRSTALTSPFTRTSSASATLSTASTSTATPSSKYTSAPLAGVAGGRLLKLLGDMYLLSGMYGDAIRCYDDGAERCRGVGDVLWESGAREGRAVAGIGEAWEGRDGSNMSTPFPNSPIPVEILTHYLSSLACLSRSPLPFPPTILSPSPQAVSGSISFAPSAPNPTQIGTGEGLLAYLYTNLCLRISHFMLIIFASGGWGSISLSALVGHHLPRSFPLFSTGTNPTERRKRIKELAKLAASSQITRHDVVGHAEAGLGPWHKALTPVEQVAIHVEAVWLARWLGLERKEGRYTREVVKRVGVMVIEGREETRRLGLGGFSRSTKQSTPTKQTFSNPSSGTELAVGLGLGMAVSSTSQAVAVRRKESVEGNAGVMKLFERVSKIAGVQLVPLGTDGEGSEWTRETEGPRFGWAELQVEMVKEGIAVAEALPDHPSIIKLCISALRNLHPYLNGISQGHLSKMYPQALATVRRRGIEIGQIPWWLPGKIILSLEVASLAPNKIPVEHCPAEILGSTETKGKRDPFLYNPRLKAAGAGKTVVVAKEQVDIFVTVQNPFAFDLEIQDLSLITAGASFSTSPLPLTLPASSIQTVRVSGLATSPGNLQIKGTTLRLKDGSSTDILLPLSDEQGKQTRDKRKSRLRTELNKVKKVGLDARDSAEIEGKEAWRESMSGEVVENFLECTVVEEQPLLWIKKSSLTHGTVMLYNGESSILRITLENSSAVPVDFIKLSFDESTIREAQLVISEGELQPEQAYELEEDMLNRPVFEWEDKGNAVSIAPGGRTILTIRCLGKVSCTDGSIRIDYGYINRTEVPATENTPFLTRQIIFPVLFTVYHTLECQTLDLLRLPGTKRKGTLTAERQNSFLTPMKAGHPRAVSPGTPRLASGSRTPVTSGYLASADEVLRAALEEESDGDHCLVGFNVRNVYGVPFEVVLSRVGYEGADLSAVRLVPPGATERIFIPVKRISLSSDILSQSIPSISERQYVVDKQKKTAEEAQLARSLFWYKEELLKTVQATWREPGSLRHGTLSLRDQVFTPDMLDILRTDDLDIRIVVEPRNQDGVVAMTDFVDIRISITNNLERSYRPFIRLEPLPSSPADVSWTTPTPPAINRRPSSIQPLPSHVKNIVFDGSLTQHLDLLGPGESGQMDVSAIFLSVGEFGFRAVVEEIDLSDSKKTELPSVRFSEVLAVNVDH